MTEIFFPLNPRPREDPYSAGIVQENLEHLAQLFQRGVNDGDSLTWDQVEGRWVATPAPPSAFPAGVMMAWSGSEASPPTGWLICNGQPVSRTTYSALFGVIGTTYGAGDGSTTFNLPDLRGRVPVGKGSNLDVDTLGENEGVAEANRRPHHRHTVTDPGHQHAITSFNEGANNVSAGYQRGDAGAGQQGDLLTTANGTGISVGPAGASLDTPAYLVLNFIIKT